MGSSSFRWGLALLAALSLWGRPLAGRAQTMPLAFSSGISVEKEGAPAQNASEVRPTVDDCEHDAATITVRHNRVVPVTEAWLGLGGVDCASTRNRSLLTSTQMAPDCKRLGEPVLDAQRA